MLSCSRGYHSNEEGTRCVGEGRLGLPGALSGEKVYFASKEMFGVTSRCLNVFEEWEFAVPAALGFVCAAGSHTGV